MTKKKLLKKLQELEFSTESYKAMNNKVLAGLGGLSVIAMVTSICNCRKKVSKSDFETYVGDTDELQDKLCDSILDMNGEVHKLSKSMNELLRSNATVNETSEESVSSETSEVSVSPELDQGFEMLKAFLKNLDFSKGFKIKVDTITSMIEAFLGQGYKIAHCDPCHLEDDTIVGDDRISFVLYLPEKKLKVSIFGKDREPVIEEV